MELLIYHKDLCAYEYRSAELDLFCFSFVALKEQLRDIYNIDVVQFLN